MVTESSPLTVSVCIPCIPIHVQYLRECLSSIENQTTLPKEVVLVVSESSPFIKQYVLDQIHPFTENLHIITRFFREKKSAGMNRNEAIKVASGDIIVSMDADDTMFPNKISIIQDIFYKNPSSVALLHYFVENISFFEWEISQKNDTKPVQELSFDKNLIVPYFFDEKNLHFGHTSFKRIIFEKCHYTDKPKIQDIDMIQQLLELPEYAKNLLIYKAPLTCYNSIRSASYDDYSQRMYDLFLYRQYKPTRANHTLPSLSVCIPCIPEHVKYLYDCFSSIANQTVLPEEVILVVSESTHTIEREVKNIICLFCDQLNIKYALFSDKQFAGTNRNEAIKIATSDIIALIDADDLMYPDRIFIVKKIFHEFPFAIGVIHYFTENISINQEKNKSISFHKNIVQAYHFTDKLHFGHACFKRSLFDEYSYSEKPRGQDLEFVNKLLIKYKQDLLIYPKPLTSYISDRSSFYHLDQEMNEDLLSKSTNNLLFYPDLLLSSALLEECFDLKMDDEQKNLLKQKHIQ
jgi:amylovoran biosynthesis glycosyltransferase AmsE